MKTIIESLYEIVSTPETWDIVLLSFKVSFLAAAIAFVFSCLLSLAIVLQYEKRKYLLALIQVFLFIPSVALGLILYLIFSRKGVLGFLGLLYTPGAIIIGEAILIFPLMVVFLTNGMKDKALKIRDTVKTLGATSIQYGCILLKEARVGLFSSFIVGLSRAIGETGLAMVVGGNIQGQTRVMTTTIVLYTMKGNFEIAIALGIILFVLAILLSLIFLILAKKWSY